MNNKICTGCNRKFPATTEYFHKDYRSKNGLRSKCKVCYNITCREYKRTHQENTKQYHRNYYSKNKEEISKIHGEYYTNNKEDIQKKHKLYQQSEEGKRAGIRGSRKYRKNHIEEERKRARERYHNNKEKASEYIKEYFNTERGKEIRKKSIRKYRSTEKGKRFLRKQKAKRRNLGYIELIPNPFSDDEEIEWHHFMGAYVVAIPKDLHQLYPGSTKYHKDGCMGIIKQIYT